jgi:predicted ATP-grasp superfamily ATP-dependent carboligase
MNKIKVLLIEGRARQVLPLAKSLYQLGAEVTTYNGSKLDPGYSSKYPQRKLLAFFDAKQPEKSFEALKGELEKYHYDMVIPLNDDIAIQLSKYKKELAKYTTPIVEDWETFQFACDKLKTMQVCMDNGIPCPKTFTSLDDFLKSEKIVSYPIVVKPRTGQAAVGFHISDSKEDVVDYFQKAEQKYGPMLIQEYIPQTDIQYKCEMYVDRKGKLKAACVFAKNRWYPVEGGSSTLNTTVNRPDIVATCKQLLEKIGWKGYADIDLIQDPRDNVAKVMEINPRITGSVKICYAAGVNFSKLIMQDFNGEKVEEAFNTNYGVQMRYMHTDVLWFIKSKERFRCNPSWFNFKNCVHQIFSWDDPWPAVTFTLQGFSKFFKDKKKRDLNK